MSDAVVRILVVGGAGATRAALAAHGAGAATVVVADRAAALDWLRGRDVPPRMIVLDVAAADAAGAVTALKADARSELIPLVVLCDSADAGVLDSCYRAGANGCVVKPADQAELCEAVAAMTAFWLGANEVAWSAD